MLSAPVKPQRKHVGFKAHSTAVRSVYNIIIPNTFAGLVGKVRKNYLPKEERREGGEKKRAQRARRAWGSNPGSAAC